MATVSRRGEKHKPVDVGFFLLGPLLVRSGGADVPVRRGRQRAVLAVLLLNAGRVVSTEKLIDSLWGDDPPPSADVAIRNYVMRLRRDLGAAGDRIHTRSPGYSIAVDDNELDISRFEELLESARTAGESGNWKAAARLAAEALALWRGEPLSDVESEALARNEVPRLAELRLRALETRIEADLNLGRHAEVTAELEQLTSTHPLREGLWAQLVLALYRDGRQAEALSAYQRAREMIVDELGIEPGAALRDLQQRILSGDPSLAAAGPEPVAAGARASRGDADSGADAGVDPGPAMPRQLPPVAGGFTGRDRELALLSGLLGHEEEQPAGSVVISVISGTAGVGKTTLAVQWAHQISDRFPDGQLYVNLRGYDPDQPVAPGDALAGFLRALGVPGERIPADPEERAAEFRSLLSGRRVLVVLDNAWSAAQVRPLLPGTSSCLVVVTSRDALAGLISRDGAARLDLDLLPADEAVRLLRRLIGERAVADPEAVARLADDCGRLPLALRVAAELANSRPGVPLADLARELADRRDRLDLLEADGDARTAVREVFSWSYRNLDAPTARVFRLAGSHPGPDFDACAAAALAGVSPADVRIPLAQLTSAHLIQPAGPGRYSLHDLLRDYARELAAAQDSAEDRRSALTRLFDYYAHTAVASSKILFPAETQQRFAVPDSPAGIPPVTSAAEAQAWLDAELTTLVAVSVHAADNGWPVHAVIFSAALFRYLDVTSNLADAQTLHGCARRAARAAGDQSAEGHALNNLAHADWRLGRFREAHDFLEQALARHRAAGDEPGEARALGNLALVSERQGQFEEAYAAARQAVQLYRETGDGRGEANSLISQARAGCRLGRFDESLGFLRRSLATFRQAGDRHGEACARDELGIVCERAGQYQEADVQAQEALAIFREIGSRDDEAGALSTLARIDWRLDRFSEGVGHARQSLALFREIGNRDGEARALNTLGGVLRATGEAAEARAQHDAALKLADPAGDLYEQARAHDGLGHLHDDLGDRDEARFHWQRALTLYTDMGTPEAGQIRALLGFFRKLQQVSGPGARFVPAMCPGCRLRRRLTWDL